MPSTSTVHRSARGFSLIELLMVVGIVGVVSAMAVPMIKNTLGDFSLSGDARALSNSVSLAKLRAASSFSQARVYIDLLGRSYFVQTWQKAPANTWVTEGGIRTLSTGVAFGSGVVGTAPPFSQAAIGQASACVTDGAVIGNTACILFNSRGIPVDPVLAPPPAAGAPTGNDAVYLTDGTAVYGETISATGLIKLWRTNPTATPAWILQ